MVPLWSAFHFFIRLGTCRLSGRRDKLLHCCRNASRNTDVSQCVAYYMPNQKIVIESNTEVIEGRPALAEAPGAQGKAGLASRTNTLFSLPMLFFMGASGHLGGAGSIPMSAQTDMGVSDLGLAVAIIIVLGLEVNAIKGKLGPMASVVGVIHMGVLLTLGLMLSLQFL